MWPARVAAEPHEEAGENEGLLAYNDTVEEDAVAAQECGYRDEKCHVQSVLEAGVNESGTAERRAHPGHLRFETRGPEKLDWRCVTIVSPLFCIYTMSAPSLAASSRRLSVSSIAPLCVHSILHCSQSFICCAIKLAHNICTLFTNPSTTLVAKQPRILSKHHFCISAHHNNFYSTTAHSSLAGQLTTSFPARSCISSPFIYTEV
jgi:hypothetical protein